MVGFESGDTMERGCCTAALCTATPGLCTWCGCAPGIMVWGGTGYHSRTLVRIAGTLNSQRYISEVLKPVVLPYLQGLATAIFQ
ncbi:transposable element Tcb1 transposase [Trichonephila clavipes]|nr:transposable element Tcb1 transposase [Trichonephila clavipes]